MNLYVTDPSAIPSPPPSHTEEDLSEFLIPEHDEIDIISEVDRTDQMSAVDFTGLDYDRDLDEIES